MEEKELVARCVRGEDAAWQEFVRRYAPVLQGLARAALRSVRRPASDADEIAARVMEMLVENDYRVLKSFRWQCALSTWLRVLVRTACTRALRRKTPGAEAAAGGVRDTPLDALLSDEARAAVRSAVDRLPERERRVLTMFFLDGLPYEQIASQLDLPMGTVATILARTRQRLRQDLRNSFPGE